jgi:mannosyltransferase
VSAASGPPVESKPSVATRARGLPVWWPLAALTLLAAVLRLSTLDLQSFWYDEAYTPVHVLHASLVSTLRGVVHHENTPPLWYVLAWADARLFGTGEVALRLPSALAGIATVPLAWAIGRELGGRRAAILAAAIVAVDPLFVWYSQEARAYGLFVFASALATVCFLRARREPTGGHMVDFALAGALALLSHYFAAFLLAGMALVLLADSRTRRAALPALAALAAVGLALVRLIVAQGGHGTQWIGRWPLGERLEAIPQYFLTGQSSASLGHGIELLVALPIVAGAGFGLWLWLDRPRAGARERAGARVALAIAGCGILVPLALALAGADYLAPRNLVGAMVPASALIAVLCTWPGTGRAAVALGATIVLALLAMSVDVELSPRLQRGDWRGLAQAIRAPLGEPRAITTVELGSAPLEYYLPRLRLRNLHAGQSVSIREIDETGYAPLRASAGEPPAPGFRRVDRLNIDGLIVYRFLAPTPRTVSESALRRHVITLAHPEVLLPAR